jgi:hypothetical protein
LDYKSWNKCWAVDAVWLRKNPTENARKVRKRAEKPRFLKKNKEKVIFFVFLFGD